MFLLVEMLINSYYGLKLIFQIYPNSPTAVETILSSNCRIRRRYTKAPTMHLPVFDVFKLMNLDLKFFLCIKNKYNGTSACAYEPPVLQSSGGLPSHASPTALLRRMISSKTQLSSDVFRCPVPRFALFDSFNLMNLAF